VLKILFTVDGFICRLVNFELLMKKHITILLLLFCKIALSQSINWVKNMEGLRNCEGYSIALDASGNVYTTGYFDSIMDFDPGPSTYTLESHFGNEIYISKLNSNGGFVWAKAFGGLNGGGTGTSVKVDHMGNIILTGWFYGSVDFDPGVNNFTINAFYGDMFVLKLDNAGNFIWAKNMGGTYITQASSLAIDPLNNVLLTGHFNGTTDFDPGPNTYNLTEANINGHGDSFVMKLDSVGNFMWAGRFGINEMSMSNCITTDNSGNVYTTGYYKGQLDFDPGAGTYILSSPSHNNSYVLKLNGNGQFLWAKQFGDSTNNCASNGIAVDNNNNIYTTGYFYGTKDFDPGAGTFTLTAPGTTDLFISKLDSMGNFVWAKNTSASADGMGHSIGLDNFNNLYIIGRYAGSSDIDSGPSTYIFSNIQPGGQPLPGIFFLKVGFSGLVKSAIVVGPGWGEQGMSVAVDPSGNVHATGYLIGSNDTIDFDMGPATHTLNTTDRNNNFIIKLKPMGTTVGVNEFLINSIDELNVYPNPNNGTFTIVSKENISLSIINNLGQMVQSIELNEGNYFQQNITINASGVYYISGNTDKTTINQKIIVTK
jgi:hypothetical protein